MQFPSPISKVLEVAPLFTVAVPLRHIFAKVMKLHPQLFDRLGEHRSKRYAFRPSDLSLAFVIEPEKPSIEVFRKSHEFKADAEIEGPIFMLLAVLEGRLDADALFFSRDVTVTGDMEAMLALRNALDDSNIDLPHDLSTLAGPFAPFAEKVVIKIRDHVLPEENASWN